MITKIREMFNTHQRYYVLPLGFVLTVFFIIPFELYYTAEIYWDWKKIIPLSIAAVGTVGYGILTGLFFLLNRWGWKRAVAGISVGLCFVGIWILFADLFAPLSTNLASGNVLHSDEPLRYTLIELGILVMMVAVCLRLKWDTTSRVFFVMTLFLAVVSMGYLGLVLSSTKPSVEKAANTRASSRITGNVYHILLDEMQTDAALIYLNQADHRSRFEGFTLFKNNLANYIYTHASFPSFITSTRYQKGSFGTWYKEIHRNRGLFKALHHHGYHVRVYGYSDFWNGPYIDQFQSLNMIYESLTGIKYREYQDFIQILTARILPNFLANEGLRFGSWLGHRVFQTFIVKNAIAKDIPVSYEEGKEPYCSVHAFKQMIQDEKNRPANGQYTYLHAVLPHPPFVYDENGLFSLDNHTNDLAGYMRQLRYAFSLVEQLIAELKRLGRYDEATIVVHADTGRGAYGFIRKQGNQVIGTLNRSNQYQGASRLKESLKDGEGVPPQLAMSFRDNRLSRLHALFMIKPPGASGPLRISPLPTQLIDIYPTLADLLGLEQIQNEVVDGNSVFSPSFPKSRNALWYWFPQKDTNPKVYELAITDPQHLESSGIRFVRIVNQTFSRPFPAHGIHVDVGGSEEGLLEFTGFGGKDPRGFRWITQKTAQIALANYFFQKETLANVVFRLQPYEVNVNTLLKISTDLSQTSVQLKKGMAEYRVQLAFPPKIKPTIQLQFQDAVSPYQLRKGRDIRTLAALLDDFQVLPPLQPFPDEGVFYQAGNDNSGQFRFEGFEPENNRRMYRWITGKSASITLSNYFFTKPSDARVTLKLSPFVINENTTLQLASDISSSRILLKKGLQTYHTVLRFPDNTPPTIYFHFQDAQSPKSLNLGPDVRPLAAILTEFSVVSP